MTEDPTSYFYILNALNLRYLFLISPKNITVRSLGMVTFPPHNEAIIAILKKKVAQFLLGILLLIDEVPVYLSETIQKHFLHMSLYFYSVCVLKISIIRYNSLSAQEFLWDSG